MSTYKLNKNILFTEGEPYVVIGEKSYFLRKQCQQLLEVLVASALKDKHASLETIGNVLWYEEGGWGPDKRQSLSDCLTDLKEIIGKASIENIYGRGYKLCYKVELYYSTEDILKDSLFVKHQSDISLGDLIDEVHRTTAVFSWVTYEIEKMEALIHEAMVSDPKTTDFLFRELEKLNATAEDFRGLKERINYFGKKMEETVDACVCCNTYAPIQSTPSDNGSHSNLPTMNIEKHNITLRNYYGTLYLHFLRGNEVCEKFERKKHDLHIILGKINTMNKSFKVEGI